MPSVLAHVKRGMAYTWANQFALSSESVQECARELSIIRFGLTAAAMPSYLVWLQFVLLNQLHPHAAAGLTVLMCVFPLCFWNARRTRLGIVVVFWVALTVLAVDMATNFDTAVSACLHALPALSAMLGGGRLVVFSTVVSLTLFFLAGVLSRTESVSDVSCGLSPPTLFVENMLFEFVAAVASTWLFARLLRRIELLQDDSDEWSRMLSRDIRTPLHGMTALADELSEEQLMLRDAESRKIMVGCTHMLHVVCDNMLGPTDFNRRNMKTVWLKALVDEVTDLAFAMTNLRLQTVKIMLEPTGSEDILIRLPLSDFLQILGNLVSNAVKFSPIKSKIAVTLSFEEGNSGNCNLRLIVEDSGLGVPPHLRETIFRPFERGDAPSGIDGLGLGLNIVAQLVAGDGGEVKCLQSTGELGGAKFDVRMPCTTEFQTSAPPKHDLSATTRDIGRVLVVDDNALNRRILIRFLESNGVLRSDIISVPSGESAIEVVECMDRPFDVAILDMVLSGMHGIELARRLSALHMRRFPNDPGIVLIGASASLTPAVARSWARVGVIKQLSKPFAQAAVTEALDFVHANRHTSSWNADTLQEYEPQLTFSPPSWPPNPVQTAREELVTQLSKLDLAIYLRIMASFISSGASLRGGYSRLLMLYFLWATTFRWVFNKRPNAFRFAVVVSVYLLLIVKSALSGCGRFVGYSTLPLFTGFFFVGTSIYWSLAICCIGQFALVALKMANFAPICLQVVNQSRAETLQDAAFMTILMAIFILVDLSLVAVASETRQRWSSTISHDVRGPLHGILAACRDLEESELLTSHAKQLLREIKTNATCILGIADAVLGLVVQRALKVDTVRLDELELTLRDLAEMALGPECAEIGRMPQPKVHVYCDEPLVMYALTQFTAAVSLMVFRQERIRFSLFLDSSGGKETAVLKISAEEAERPPSLNALQFEFVDKAAVVWGSEGKRSALARIVEDIIGGTVSFIKDVPTNMRGVQLSSHADNQAPWKLAISIPVICAPLEDPSVIGAKLMTERAGNAELHICNMRVAMVDDARLNLRVFQRLLNKCGVTDIIQFLSARLALTALDHDDLDNLDVIFLDLRMPTMDGFELAGHIVEHFAMHNNPAPTLVACSADTSTVTVQRCVKAGIKLRLSKPFTEDALMHMLVKIMTRRIRASTRAKYQS